MVAQLHALRAQQKTFSWCRIFLEGTLAHPILNALVILKEPYFKGTLAHPILKTSSLCKKPR